MRDEVIEIPELSKEILKELRKLKYDPKAINFYEWLSGDWYGVTNIQMI